MSTSQRKSIVLMMSLCFAIMIGVYSHTSLNNLFFPPGKINHKKPLIQKIEGRYQEREQELMNYDTKTVIPQDWYNALKQILLLESAIHTRGNSLPWENMGPDQVGGRTCGFVFDTFHGSRCYTGGVSGGLFVSEDLGFNWKPVKNLDINSPVMSISCMKQSINGDIYAGTGEYWGNVPNGAFISQFYGGGIYKKKVDEDEFFLLPSTFIPADTNKVNNKTKFIQVIDIACHPTNENNVYAATADVGLQITTDGGTTWKAAGGIMSSGTCSQIEVGVDKNGNTILYAGNNGKTYRSNDNGTTWVDLIGTNTAFQSANQNRANMQIAVSPLDVNKVYVAGIDSKPGGDLKYVIKSTDAGATWRLIGKSDALLKPLCSDIGANATCQGFYDLTMTVHPVNDDLIFLGGMQSMYSWSESNGWVLISFWNSPAVDGNNKVHSDMHGMAINPKYTDTMVVCTDGGNYMSYNAYSKSSESKWVPRNSKFNVTQFYDLQVTKYGELVGGTQDNGTNLITLRGSTTGASVEVSGGDGFDSGISAENDYQTIYSTVYEGTLARSSNLNATKSNIVGSCADKSPMDQKIDNMPFHTRIHVAEKVTTNGTFDGKRDTVDRSLLFVLNSQGFFISNNAHNVNQYTLFTNLINLGGQSYVMHHSPTLSVGYIGGAFGLYKITGMNTASFNKVNVGVFSCIDNNGITPLKMTGISGVIGGVYVDQTNDNHVIATAIGFGGTAKIFESTNGSSFVSKQGNLPIMPTYSVVIDPTDSKHVVVGTEFGVWETEDITASSPSWVPQYAVMGRVPVFKLRLLDNKDNCSVLYAATHGRGFWRVPFPYNATCDYTPKGRPVTGSIKPFINVGIEFDVYPNPASKEINVSYRSKKVENAFIGVYDINGKLIKREHYNILTGDNVLTTDISSLSNGTYIIRLENNIDVIGGRIFKKN